MGVKLLTMCAILASASLFCDVGGTAPGSQDSHGNPTGPCAPWDGNGVMDSWLASIQMIDDHYAVPEPENQN